MADYTNTDKNTNDNKKITKKSLKIISINVNSIITNQRRASLLNLINKHNPDITLISETKLNKTHKIQFKNYDIIRTDRYNATQGGGTAILIKKPIAYQHITPKSQQENNKLETTIIKLELKENENLFIISAYTSHGNNEQFNQDFNNLFKNLQLNQNKNYYIIAGDFNAKHTSWKNDNYNTKGTFIKNWLDKNDMTYKTKLYSSELPSFPRGNSYLDLCFADARLNFINERPNSTLKTIDYDSDHNGLLIEIGLNTSTPFELFTQSNDPKLNYKKTNWQKFRKKLDESCDLDIQDDINLSNEQIDFFLNEIEKHIQNTINDVVPKIADINSCESYVNEKIKKLQRDKNYLLKQINKIHRNYTRDKNLQLGNLQNLLNEVKIKLKQEFTNSINKYWSNKIEKIPANDPSMFPQVNQIFRPKGFATIPNLKIPQEMNPLLQQADIDPNKTIKDGAGNSIISNKIDKLNVIGAHFANTHIQNEKLGREELTRIIIKETDNLKQEMTKDEKENTTITVFSSTNPSHSPKQPDNILNYFTNFLNLSKIFSKLNNKKSSGLDGIPNIVLKQLPLKIIQYYTILFNNALNNSYFPTKWKKAKIISITKKDKDGSLPSNLRPISLLPNISKVFEIVINEPLVTFCKKNNIIPENQFGFRHKHSTLHAINKFTSDVCWALNSKQRVGACLIDLEKAFDTVWIPGLIYKMIKKNFPKYLIKMIWNMINNKSFVTAESSTLSSKEFIVKNGLQQGTVNSPVLFNIFNSDLLNLFDLNTTSHKRSIAFADDLIVYITGKKTKLIQKDLQNLFEKIQMYYHTWKLKINAQKCETILFRQKLSELGSGERKHSKNFQIRERENEGVPIPHKKDVRYLGVQIDERLHYNKHVETQLKKAKNAFWKLKRLFYSKHLNKRIKTLCYQALVRPIITYGCPIWYNISASLMEKIRVFERKCIRSAMNTYRTEASDYKKYVKSKTLYDLANVHRIDCHILKLTRNHFAQTAKIKENSLIFGALYPNPEYHKKTLNSGYIPPEAFLYLDEHNYIQDQNNVPIIYHINRRMKNKTINYEPNLNSQHFNTSWRFNKEIPQRDVRDKHRYNTEKYWWLTKP